MPLAFFAADSMREQRFSPARSIMPLPSSIFTCFAAATIRYATFAAMPLSAALFARLGAQYELHAAAAPSAQDAAAAARFTLPPCAALCCYSAIVDFVDARQHYSERHDMAR